MNKKDKEELLKEIDRRLKVLRDEFIASLDDKEEFELTYPEHEKTLYYISNASANICDIYFFDNDNFSKNVFEHGLYFETKEEAEQHLKERKLLFKIYQYAKEKNEGWKPDWANLEQQKYYIEIDMNLKSLVVRYTCFKSRFDKLPFFESEEIAQACIDEFAEEIKEVLC